MNDDVISTGMLALFPTKITSHSLVNPPKSRCEGANPRRTQLTSFGTSPSNMSRYSHNQENNQQYQQPRASPKLNAHPSIQSTKPPFSCEQDAQVLELGFMRKF